VHKLISNVLHNLAWNQWDATQSDEVKMLMSYVSYRHALMMFKVELFKWEMEVVLMHLETLHSAIVWLERENGQWIEEASWDWNQYGKYLHIINIFWRTCQSSFDAMIVSKLFMFA